mmetsp:Transcript_34914/g.67925  ORF Transcript_34914/g.67925 Transcript_34914/m.67925 type:complete len:148 (+) Transcript_34914:70-513(+)
MKQPAKKPGSGPVKEEKQTIPKKRPPKSRYPVQKSDAEWKKQLTKEEYKILRKKGTQRSGCGEYDRVFPKSGYFGCRGCGHPLYSAKAKFPDSGWSAFDKCYHSTEGKCHVKVREDMGGLEVVCANCGSHLGHVFYGERHTKTNERH